MSISVSRISAVIVLLFFLTACQQETTPPTAGVVEANQAYLNAFGEPPKVRTGKAYARVGYFPLKENPATVGAVPLYIYEPVNQLPKILRQLVGDVLVLPQNSPMFKPFPPGTTIQLVSNEGNSLVLSLETGGGVTVDAASMTIALAETALQYENVSEVVVLINGQRHGPFAHVPQRIAAPAPPDLVMVAGIWDEGEEDPEEIVINFDRPVTVDSFSLTHQGGEKVAGDYFTSVFQMAVVVHPGKPQSIYEGMELKVEWRVTDALGRVGSGQRGVTLERFDHKAELGDFPQK